MPTNPDPYPDKEQREPTHTENKKVDKYPTGMSSANRSHSSNTRSQAVSPVPHRVHPISKELDPSNEFERKHLHFIRPPPDNHVPKLDTPLTPTNNSQTEHGVSPTIKKSDSLDEFKRKHLHFISPSPDNLVWITGHASNWTWSPYIRHV